MKFYNLKSVDRNPQTRETFSDFYLFIFLYSCPRRGIWLQWTPLKIIDSNQNKTIIGHAHVTLSLLKLGLTWWKDFVDQEVTLKSRDHSNSFYSQPRNFLISTLKNIFLRFHFEHSCWWSWALLTVGKQSWVLQD